MAGDFGSTGGINSRGMPDRVERVYSRRQRGGGGTVGPDYEQDIIPYRKKRFYQHYPVAIIFWLLSHTVAVSLLAWDIDNFVSLLLAGDYTTLIVFLSWLAVPLVLASMSLIVRYRMFKRFQRIAVTEDDKGTEMLEVFE